MTTIRTREPRELLALIPYQLGFRPQDSAVVVSLRRERSRVGLVARVDLADLADPVDGRPLARSLVGHLLADGATSAVLVLYAPGTVRPGDGGAAACALDVFRSEAEASLGEVPAWQVAATGYRAVGCTDPACCPTAGRPLSDLQATQVGAHMVMAGRQVAAARDELVATRAVASTARRAARRAADRWAARLDQDAAPAAAHRWRRAGLAAWREEVAACAAAPGTAVGAARLGRLQAALADVLVRDAVMLGLVPGGEALADRVVAGYCGDEVGRALGAIVDPVLGVEPDPRTLDPVSELLEQIAGHAARARCAPALTLLALVAWWQGDGARAGVCVERALTAQPDYRLAALLETTVRAGMPPGWLRARTA